MRITRSSRSAAAPSATTMIPSSSASRTRPGRSAIRTLTCGSSTTSTRCLSRGTGALQSAVMTIIAAADGSALGNPGPAGWAWYVDDETWAAGGWEKSTNNRGELTAVAELLAATAHRSGERLHIMCDSQYVINSVTKWMPGWKRKGWKKRDGKPVLNVDILSRIDELRQGRDVHFEWVKGHAGHDMNEAADLRARAVAEAYRKGEAPNEGPGFPGAAP